MDRERASAGTRPRASYALGGVALAIGAPAGWLAVRLATGLGRLSLADELATNAALYAYLLLSTSAAFAAFGYALGARAEELGRAARRDALTGLANRRALDEALARAAAEAARYDAPVAVALFDLDRFKRVNDLHGHAAGDDALRAVARALVGTVRHADVVGRYGGEEFLLVLPRTTSTAAVELAERALDAIRAVDVATRSGAVRVTASCGVAGGVPRSDAWPARLVESADRALYAAKRAGRDRVVTAVVAD